MSRRRFIKNLGLAGAGLAFNPLKSKAQLPNLTPPIKNNPLVISTWIHGMEANAGAWEILSNGGNALDAVQKGVAVTENDLNNRSVGLGGRPDRDGHVTLDACIMDHDSRCGAVAFLEEIIHPIDVARAIMDKTPHVMLVGTGAQQWALDNGFTKASFQVPVPPVQKDYEEWRIKSEYKTGVNVENHDTIGMFFQDALDNIIACFFRRCTASHRFHNSRGPGSANHGLTNSCCSGTANIAVNKKSCTNNWTIAHSSANLIGHSRSCTCTRHAPICV